MQIHNIDSKEMVRLHHSILHRHKLRDPRNGTTFHSSLFHWKKIPRHLRIHFHYHLHCWNDDEGRFFDNIAKYHFFLRKLLTILTFSFYEIPPVFYLFFVLAGNSKWVYIRRWSLFQRRLECVGWNSRHHLSGQCWIRNLRNWRWCNSILTKLLFSEILKYRIFIVYYSFKQLNAQI